MSNKVMEALNLLGATESEVVQSLSQANIRGTPNHNDTCPIACYLHNVLNPVSVQVSTDRIRVTTSDGGFIVLEEEEIPTHICTFIDNFDDGEYPQLELPDEDEDDEELDDDWDDGWNDDNFEDEDEGEEELV